MQPLVAVHVGLEDSHVLPVHRLTRLPDVYRRLEALLQPLHSLLEIRVRCPVDGDAQWTLE